MNCTYAMFEVGASVGFTSSVIAGEEDQVGLANSLIHYFSFTELKFVLQPIIVTIIM